MSTAVWNHAVFVRRGAAYHIYLNGVDDGHETWSGATITINNPNRVIGRDSPASGGEIFHGFLDEIRIWNIARTQEEIQTTMNTMLTGEEKGLVGYWNFDDGAVKDLSKNGNDGVLQGEAQIGKEELPGEFTHQEIVVVEEKIANPSEQFTTLILIRLAEKLQSFTFDLTFDPSVLGAVSVKEGTFLSSDGVDATTWQTPTIDNEKGVIRSGERV